MAVHQLYSFSIFTNFNKFCYKFLTLFSVCFWFSSFKFFNFFLTLIHALFFLFPYDQAVHYTGKILVKCFCQIHFIFELTCSGVFFFHLLAFFYFHFFLFLFFFSFLHLSSNYLASFALLLPFKNLAIVCMSGYISIYSFIHIGNHVQNVWFNIQSKL